MHSYYIDYFTPHIENDCVGVTLKWRSAKLSYPTTAKVATSMFSSVRVTDIMVFT